jgi:hypothetical protein
MCVAILLIPAFIAVFTTRLADCDKRLGKSKFLQFTLADNELKNTFSFASRAIRDRAISAEYGEVLSCEVELNGDDAPDRLVFLREYYFDWSDKEIQIRQPLCGGELYAYLTMEDSYLPVLIGYVLMPLLLTPNQCEVALISRTDGTNEIIIQGKALIYNDAENSFEFLDKIYNDFLMQSAFSWPTFSETSLSALEYEIVQYIEVHDSDHAKLDIGFSYYIYSDDINDDGYIDTMFLEVGHSGSIGNSYFWFLCGTENGFKEVFQGFTVCDGDITQRSIALFIDSANSDIIINGVPIEVVI